MLRAACVALLARGTLWTRWLVWMTRAWTAAAGRGRRTIESIIYDAASGTASANIPAPPPGKRTEGDP